MKVKILPIFLIAVLFGISTNTFSQALPVTNGSFEDWETVSANGRIFKLPTDWDGIDRVLNQFIVDAPGSTAPESNIGDLIPFFLPMNDIQMIFDETLDFHQGIHSARIVSDTLIGGNFIDGPIAGLIINSRLNVDARALINEIVAPVLEGGSVSIDLQTIIAASDLSTAFNPNKNVAMGSEKAVAEVYAYVKDGTPGGSAPPDVDHLEGNFFQMAVILMDENGLIYDQPFSVKLDPSQFQDWKLAKIKIQDIYMKDQNGQDSLAVKVDLENDRKPTKLLIGFTSGDFTHTSQYNTMLVDDVSYLPYGNKPLLIDDVHFDANVNGNDVVLTWKASVKDNVAAYTVQHSSTGKADDWKDVSSAFGQEAGKNYSFAHKGLNAGNHFYRLKVDLLGGKTDYSLIKGINIKLNADIKLWPNPVTNGSLHLTGIPQGSAVSIVNAAGQEVLRQSGANQRADINVSGLPGGVYYVRVMNGHQLIFATQVIKK